MKMVCGEEQGKEREKGGKAISHEEAKKEPRGEEGHPAQGSLRRKRRVGGKVRDHPPPATAAFPGKPGWLPRASFALCVFSKSESSCISLWWLPSDEPAM